MQRELVTKHFVNDRIERATYISKTVGFGDVVFTDLPTANNTYKEVTKTGVIVVRGDDRVIVTMFIATPSQIVSVYASKGARVPQWLYQKAKKNSKYMKNQPLA